MNEKTRLYISGQISYDQMKKLLIVGYAVFWLLILLARITFPPENNYRIGYDTFSFLGSWDSDNNYVGWFFFCIGLVWWAIFSIPLVMYFYRRFIPVAKSAAVFGMILLLIGCLGMLLVGLFPDVHESEILPGLTFSAVHGKISLLGFGGWGLGLIWFGFMLMKDRFTWFPHGGQQLFDHKKVLWPYLAFTIMFTLGAYFLIAWEFVYPVLKESDSTVSHWGSALGTVYSFPLWENLLIYTLMIIIPWFMLVIPKKIPNQNINSE